MAKLSASQIWLSVLVAALFAPVYLSSGSAYFRPAWFTQRFHGVPLSVWLVLGLIAIFVVLVCLFAGAAFGAAEPGAKSKEAKR